MQCKNNFSITGEQSCVILLTCHTNYVAAATITRQPAAQMQVRPLEIHSNHPVDLRLI